MSTIEEHRDLFVALFTASSIMSDEVTIRKTLYYLSLRTFQLPAHS